MPIIAATGLTKIYGRGDAKFKALNDVNLTIDAGESVAIIGKSGSGKSTLMHLLALLDKPSSGSVLVRGKNSNSLNNAQIDAVRNEDFGFVFQQFFLNEKDSVINNVTLPLKIGKVSRRARDEQGKRILEMVELGDKAHTKAGNLSGGQKQRACIARALIREPKIIFADEPTGNLDSQTGKTIENLLFSLNQENGITLIIVTHDSEVARRCGRQIHISDGQLISKGAV